MGGMFAAAFGQSFEEIAMYVGNAAVAVGLVTLGIWVMGILGLQLGQ